MKLFGESAPGMQDGYIPGAWDEIRRLHMDGRITDEAYDLVRTAVNRGAVALAQDEEKEDVGPRPSQTNDEGRTDRDADST
jgi:hypothetical protein